MNKLTKVLSVFIIAGAVGAGVAGVAGCKKDKGHSHSIDSTKWTDNYDGTHDGHCSCGELMVDDEEHVIVDGKCIKCEAPEGEHEHKYTYTDNSDGTHNGTCVCGKDSITNEPHHYVDGACKECNAAQGPVVESVTISGDSTIEEEMTVTYTATVTGSNGVSQKVKWTVTNGTGEATITEEGVLTAVKAGTVTVKATADDDKSKFGEKTVTINTQTDYGKLMNRSDKITVLDSSYTVGSKLSTLEDYATKGIYFRPQTGGSTAATDPARDYVEVISENGTTALKQHGSDGSTSGLPNVYTEIVIGGVKGTVTGYFETKINALTKGDANDNGQNPIAFLNNGSSALKITAKGGNLSYTVAGGTETAISGVTLVADTYIKVYFVFDLENGKTTLKLNDTTVMNEVETGITSIDCIELATSNKGARVQTTKSIVVCGTPKSLEDSKTDAKATVAAELEKYDTTLYTINGSELTAAKTAAESAIDAATDIDGVNKAVKDCRAAMADVLADADIASAIQAAKDALAEKFPADNYNIDYAEDDDDAIYNNKTKYAQEIAAIEEQIEGGATTKSALDKIVADATITIGDNAVQLAAKKAAVTGADGIIATYRADKIAEIETDHADQYAEIGEIKVQAILDVNAATSIEAINTIVAQAKKDIDGEISSTEENLEQTIARYQGLLEADGTAAKSGVTDEAKIAEVEAAVTAGKSAIAAVTNKDDVSDVYKDEKVKVQTAIPKYEAKATLLTDKNAAVAEIHGDSEAASTASSAVTDAYNDGVTGIDGATTTTAIDGALDTAQKAIETAINTLKAAKFTITVKKADGTTISNGLEIGYGKTLVIDNSKLTLTDSEKLDKFYSKCENKVLSEEITLSEVKVYNNVVVYASITEAKKIEITNAFSYSAINSTGFATRPYTDKTAGDNVYLDNNDFVNANSFLTVNGVTYDAQDNTKIASSPVTWRKSNDAIQNVGAGLSFTVNGAATVTIKFSSTGGSNESRLGLQDASGNYIEAKSKDSAISLVDKTDTKAATDTTPEQTFDNIGSYKISGATGKEIVFSVLEAGTYTIVCPNDYTGRGARIYAIKVEQSYKVDLDVSVTWGTETKKYYHDDTIALPETTPVGKGEFAGWYYTVGGVETKFEGGKLAAGNYTMTAKFEYNVEITYKVNEDDENEEPTVLYIKAKDGNELKEKLPTLEPKDGNAHSGWTYENDVPVDFATINVGDKDNTAAYTFKPVYSDPTSIKVETITVTAPKSEDGEPITKVVAGKTIQLTATVTPDNAYNKAVTWSCATVGVTISDTGLVTVAKTVAPGTITIVATAKDSEESETPVTGSITLTVEEAPAVESESYLWTDFSSVSTVKKDAVIVDKTLFTATALADLTGKTPEKDIKDANGNKVTNAYTLATANLGNQVATSFISIKANEKIKVTVLMLATKNDHNGARESTVSYKINGVLQTKTISSGATKNQIDELEFELNAGDVLELIVTGPKGKTDVAVDLFGIKAEISA